MTSFEIYTQKKTDISEKLNSAFHKKLKDKNTMAFCELLATKFKVSKQTIYNYVGGNIKDGYLAEAILLEIKNTDYNDI